MMDLVRLIDDTDTFTAVEGDDKDTFTADEGDDKDTFMSDEDGSDSGDDFIVRVCSDEEIVDIPIWSFDTVLQLKKQIQREMNVAVADQRLYFRGKRMKDARTLSYHNVGPDDVIKLLPPWAPTSSAVASASTGPAPATASTATLASLEERLQKLHAEMRGCLSVLRLRIDQIEERIQS
jgi:hypothetical protein